MSSDETLDSAEKRSLRNKETKEPTEKRTSSFFKKKAASKLLRGMQDMIHTNVRSQLRTSPMDLQASESPQASVTPSGLSEVSSLQQASNRNASTQPSQSDADTLSRPEALSSSRRLETIVTTLILNKEGSERAAKKLLQDVKERRVNSPVEEIVADHRAQYVPSAVLERAGFLPSSDPTVSPPSNEGPIEESGGQTETTSFRDATRPSTLSPGATEGAEETMNDPISSENTQPATGTQNSDGSAPPPIGTSLRQASMSNTGSRTTREPMSELRPGHTSTNTPHHSPQQAMNVNRDSDWIRPSRREPRITRYEDITLRILREKNTSPAKLHPQHDI